MAKNQITKPRSISGFPEWLPEQQRLQDRWMSSIKNTFESFGYQHVETAAIELTEVLAAKGVEQKEIYSLTRLQAEDKEESRYSLHFDLTVPFARYVALNQAQLTFPFKRYQMQKVWRGERPAQGRFREFYQCDIDIVGIDNLPLSFDAELLEVMGAVFSSIDSGDVILKCNHRKILQGFYEGLGLEPEVQSQVLIEVDKIEKVGKTVLSERLGSLGVTKEKADKILKLATSCHGVAGLESHFQSFGIESELFSEGVRELLAVLNLVPARDGVELIWDGSIARGLNYYTGIIFETTLKGSEELGSICSGGRYEDLCARFSKTRMPGVGISLGLTRLFSHILAKRELDKTFSSDYVLMISMSKEQVVEQKAVASAMRSNGWKVELTPVGKLKKLINYANKKGIPNVIIPNEDGSFEWKDMLSGEQERIERDILIKKQL